MNLSTPPGRPDFTLRDACLASGHDYIQIMDFYDRLALWYDDLFPPDEASARFLGSLACSPDRRALDAGCATGTHALALASTGWSVFGIDSSATMIERARMKALAAGIRRVRFECGDMTDIRGFSEHGPFSLLLCLGNTLPHVGRASVGRFLADLRSIASDGASMVLQTLNYAHPDIGPGFVFPTLEAPGVVFGRRYAEGPEGTLKFETRLDEVDESGSGSSILVPYLPAELGTMLLGAGFSRVTRRGGWEKQDFDEGQDRYLVLVAEA